MKITFVIEFPDYTLLLLYLLVASYHQILDHFGTTCFSFEWCGVYRVHVQ